MEIMIRFGLSFGKPEVIQDNFVIPFSKDK